MYTSSANTTPLCGTIINRDPFYRFIADHFGPQRFRERHGMLCASGRRVRVMGRLMIFAAANVAVFLLF